MANKKHVDFKASLTRLDSLGSARADEIVGKAPGPNIEERLARAASLESGPARAPLATVTALRPDELRAATMPDASNDGGYIRFRPGMVVRVGDRLTLRADIIKPNEFNPRAFYFDSDIKDRSISLANDGQLLAVQVYLPENGVFELHDGETRWRSLQLVGNESINVEVVERNPNPLVRFKQARTLNTERKSQTVFDDAVRFTDLLVKKLVRENLELANLFGLSPVYVSKVLSIGEMPRGLLERMAQHPDYFGIANAYAMYQFWSAQNKDVAAVERIIAKVIDGKLSVRDVKNLLEHAGAHADDEAPQRKRERPLSRAEIRSGAKGELKAFPDGKLQLVLSEIPEQSRALLFNRILQLFDECGLSYDHVGAPAEQNGKLL